jgi:hypothetical protein
VSIPELPVIYFNLQAVRDCECLDGRRILESSECVAVIVKKWMDAEGVRLSRLRRQDRSADGTASSSGGEV